jgi:signal transduction histidine kinase
MVVEASMREYSRLPQYLLDFAELIQDKREEVLREWRREVRRLPAAKSLDTPTLDDHIPPLLNELASALKAGNFESILDLELEQNPRIHGTQRLRSGFDIVEVVAEYNILRELLQSLAERNGVDISGPVNRILNRVIDRGVALAVDTYAKDRAVEIQKRREEHLSFMMHDLRTPLSAMHTAGLILENSLPEQAKTDRVKNMLELLKRNGNRLNALLSIANQEQHNIAVGVVNELRVERREFDLWILVEGLIRDLRPLSEPAPVELLNTVPEDFIINADPLLLTQVFQNLLSNAIKYTKNGQIVISADKTTEGAMCWVSDTGEGIPPERIEKVFEKLETDPTRPGGLGLGLAIVKQIVEAHGGTISVHSSVGRGTTFKFSIPPAPTHQMTVD